MLSAHYVGQKTIEIRTSTSVPPGEGEVQIAVAYVGICGTDLHILHGAMDQRITHSGIIGHEMSGTIAAVGPGVDGWADGDAVTVMPLAWDGTCPACLAGHSHICQNLDFIGIDSTGALQEYWNVPASTLVRLPEGMSLAHAALVEPVAVAAHDVRRSGLTAGDNALIIGGGPIGVLIATVAREAGAEVRLFELDPQRRAAAEALGIEVADPTSPDAADAIETWTGGAGADVVFEVSGSAAAVLTATSFVKVRGTLVIVAIHPQPRPIDLHRVFWRELTIVGARVYEREDFERAASLLARGVIPADALITETVPLGETANAFATLESGRAMKVLVDVRAPSLSRSGGPTCAERPGPAAG
ncbi:zinc-dependent alcohol dehydrogenase [Pseudoclavibacter sp. VKM Ac-2888]|uniref:zinc-dependent alcohol dehydrogenase n=1 Tax=Pseudoclavibacter sp. VKM Ac-2888 TaxID=2783830 RepID=UPI00188D8525|nr:alcohol dehydrogenase catalytic domain-containing protein [Pseudoclavibacter sp. VKM Ac-2888]MBF4550449.1 alcohol dehydrogenase catalytic domain-containing protein [Pseudoclavibacter sp. VKM Ac-2888]